MKKLINLTLIAIASLAVACHKDAQLTTLQPVNFNATVTSSASAVTLTGNTDSTDVITLKWTAAVYPAKLAVKYVVQIDVPTDTASWANAKTATVGTNILTKTFKGADINNWALALGIPANETGSLVFRVQAYEDRYVYSKPVVVSVTTYQHIFVAPAPQASLGFATLWLPGFYQNWSPSTAGTVAAPGTVYKTTGVYEGFIYMPASTDPAAYDFKFTSAPDWNHINYGNAGTAGNLTVDGNAGDLVLPGPGFYELSANPTTLTWTATPETWAIIGDATPNGWGTETEMTYDPAYHAWKVTLNLIHAGSFKFRANNAWNIDFGIQTSTGQIYFADNPIFGGGGCSNIGLDNLTVPEDGNYTIYLDLSDPNTFRYYLDKH